jgi:predicted AlkP superfamily pyrophosphatase or phosphodiesterase
MTAYPLPLDPGTAPAPRYGSSALSDLLPALAAGFGVRLDLPPSRAPQSDTPQPEIPQPADGLELTPADRVCVFLVDGLGWELIRSHPAEAPFLTSLLPTSLAGTGRPLQAAFPSTTATSLASFGTGLPPGRHGLVGYTVAIPGENRLMNQLRWQPRRDPRTWQPYPTVFRQLQRAGIPTTHISLPSFADTPMTKAALSGGSFHGRFTGEERVDLAARRLAAEDRALVFTYYSELDSMGHRHGVDSPEWRGQLREVDRLTRRLAEQLPPRSVLYLTADHGMIDIAPENRVDFDEDWELRAGVALLGGEGRARHLYAVPGGARDVLAVWSEVMGEQMWVASREQAVAAGWFGPEVDERVYERIGDVVAAARDDIAVIATRQEPGESSMVGLHGSFTPVEQHIPLLEVRG